MLLTQNVNINAQSLNRLFNQSQARANQSMERLASAKRVNHAGDDVAALGIHTRLEKQVLSANKEREGLQNEISFAHSMNRVEQTQFDIAQADERIMSTDFAIEVAELTRQQIKQNLGAELLSKVNIDRTLALALVQSGES